MGNNGKTTAAMLATLAVLACAALLPYQAMKAADVRRLEAPIARPVGTGQPEPKALEDSLALALYRRGQYFRNGGGELTYFTPDESRPLPVWESTLASVRTADFIPDAFRSPLALEPDLSAPSWDKTNFWRLNSVRPEKNGVTGWYLVGEPQSGKAVYMSVSLEGTPQCPDLNACLDAWRGYLGLDGLPGWQRAQAPAPYLTILTDTCPDAQLMLTIAWQATDNWASLTFSANLQADMPELEEGS